MSLLNDAALHHFENLNHRIDLNSLKQSQHTELMKVLGLSDFVAESLIKQPTLLSDLLDSELLTLADRKEIIETELKIAIAKVADEVTLHKVLRLFRRKHMVVIAWRELLGKASLAESLAHISYLADQLIRQTMFWLYNKQ
ncbi:MAG TPA: bifunctional glutamine synthetase adenylyltransferase/deadenyltransferase, partial [Psychromonas sp.]